MKEIKINEKNGNETEIININFDSYNLTISVHLDNNFKTAIIVFESPAAFFVADETDFNYWNTVSLRNGFIFEVDDVINLKNERKNNGHVISGSDFCKNYIVVGKNNCIEIVTKIEPKILILDSKS